MIAKEITYKELEKALVVVFGTDYDILSLCDPNVAVTNTSELAADVLRKIKEYDDVKLMGIYEKNELVGYYTYQRGMLISFGISPKMRVRRYTKEFFRLIRHSFKAMFVCSLWNRNTRAIAWLSKMGMKIMNRTEQITVLVY